MCKCVYVIMAKCNIVILIVCFSALLCQCYANTETYTAAVVGLKAEKFLTKPEYTLYFNVQHYASIANYLMNNTTKVPDIIVFPEKGLLGENEPYPIEVPSTEDFVIPCIYGNRYSMPLRFLSCTARQMKVYLVVNLVESHLNASTNQTMRFNTDVVFNRQGAIVARYRKSNLNEPGYDVPGLPEATSFESDFGVTFGLFTGNDILFKEPINTLLEKNRIKHFLHPTRWDSELPYLTGIQIQSGWAYATNCILLSAGYNDPMDSNSGSGIYHGHFGPILYSQPESSKAYALVSEVPKDTNQPKNVMKGLLYNTNSKPKSFVTQLERVITQPSLLMEMSVDEMEEKMWSRHLPSKSMKSIVFRSMLKLKRDNINSYETKLIESNSIKPGFSLKRNETVNITTETNINETICTGKKNKFCCKFEINVNNYYAVNLTTSDYIVSGDNFTNYYYRIAVFDGNKNFSDGLNPVPSRVQTCGIIPCLNKSVNSCGIRTDNYDTEPPTISPPAAIVHLGKIFTKTSTKFNFIKITAEIRGKDSDIYPVLLQKGSTTDEFGSLSDQPVFDFYKEDCNDTDNQMINLKTNTPISDLGSIGIYARVYKISSSTINSLTKILLFLPLFIIYNYSIV